MGCGVFRRAFPPEPEVERRPARPQPISEPDGTSPVRLGSIQVDTITEQQRQNVPLSPSRYAVVEGPVKPEAADHDARAGGRATAQPPGCHEVIKPRVDCWRPTDISRRQGVENTSAARGRSADNIPARTPAAAPGQQRTYSASRPASGSALTTPPQVKAPATANRRPSSGSATSASQPRPRVSDAGSNGKAMPKQAESRSANQHDAKGGGKSKKPKSCGDLDEHEQNLMKDVLDATPGVSWDSIVGLDEVKRLFWEIVVAPVKNPALFSGVRAPPRGVLLFGPPGNGKTLLAKAVATECDATFFSISASSLTSKWVGESEKQMRALFSLARKLQPSIIFIDEIDSMLTSRSSGEHEAARRLKTEFLVQVDGAGTSAGGAVDRVLVLGATNRPGELDDAVLRRLTRRILIPLPDSAARAHLVTKELQATRHVIGQRELMKIASITENYSCSDLAALTREAAMGPVRGLSAEALVSATPDSVRPINVADFEAAARKVRPSIAKEALVGFQDWNRRFGSS